jgi:hypothetical protein
MFALIIAALAFVLAAQNAARDGFGRRRQFPGSSATAALSGEDSGLKRFG